MENIFKFKIIIYPYAVCLTNLKHLIYKVYWIDEFKHTLIRRINFYPEVKYVFNFKSRIYVKYLHYDLYKYIIW